MQFCVELAPPWTRDLTTLQRVQASALGPAVLVESLPTYPQQVSLPGDDEINRLIAAASSAIETYINRTKTLLQGQYREHISGDGGPAILLSATPVESISGITRRGQAMTADWIFDPTTGGVFRPGGWEFTGQVSRNIEDTFLPQSSTLDFEVTYTGGYVSPALGTWAPQLPAEIEQAAIVTVLQWVQTQSQNLTIQRTRIGDFTQTFFAGSSNVGGVRGLPIPVMDMLAPFRRIV